MRSARVAAALVTTGLMVVAACGGEAPPAEGESDSVTVGYLANLTGEAAGAYGIPFDEGMSLALEEVESSGYLDETGLTIDVEREDTGTELKTAVTQYNQMRDAGVDLVLSDSISTIAAGIAPLATEDSMLFLTGSGTALEDTNGYGFWLADLNTPMVTLGSRLAEQGLTDVVAVVDGDNPSFQTLADSFEQGLNESGGEPLADTVTVSATDTDFSSLVTTLKDSGAGGLLLSTLPEQAGNILRQLQQAGGLANLEPVGTIAWSEQVYAVAGSAAVGPLFALPWAPGLKQSAEFEESYAEAYDKAPNAYSAIGYQTGWLIAVAAKQISEAGDEVDSETLKDALPDASTSDDLAAHGIIDGFSLTRDGAPSYPGVVATFTEKGTIVAAQE